MLNIFYYCSKLNSIVIPNSITMINNETFRGCKGLTSVILPESITSIGTSAFSDCDALTTITIPNSVTYISNCAFIACDALSSVIIGSNVTSIGDQAFSSPKITKVISLIVNPFKIYGKVDWLHTFNFDTFNKGTLYVPTGTKDKYIETEGWKDFKHIEEGAESIADGINLYNFEPKTNYRYFNLNGQMVEKLMKGVIIVNGKKVLYNNR